MQLVYSYELVLDAQHDHEEWFPEAIINHVFAFVHLLAFVNYCFTILR